IRDPHGRFPRDLFITQFRNPQPATGEAPRNYFLVQSLPDPLVRILRPPEGVVHRERPGPAEDLMVDVECGADGQPRVSRRGRDNSLPKRSSGKKQAVRQQVEPPPHRPNKFSPPRRGGKVDGEIKAPILPPDPETKRRYSGAPPHPPIRRRAPRPGASPDI